MTMNKAEETVVNGRDKNGRFSIGNSYARGNPYTKRVANFRKVIAESVTNDDMAAVMAKLVENAKDGDCVAIKLFLSYTVGHPQAFENPSAAFLDYELEKCIKITLIHDLHDMLKRREPPNNIFEYIEQFFKIIEPDYDKSQDDV